MEMNDWISKEISERMNVKERMEIIERVAVWQTSGTRPIYELPKRKNTHHHHALGLIKV